MKLLATSSLLASQLRPGDRRKRLDGAAEIVTVDESGFLIEAPVMLGRETEVKLDRRCSISWGVQCNTLTTSRAPRPAAQGGYVNEINLLGIGPKVAKAIRNYIRERADEVTSK